MKIKVDEDLPRAVVGLLVQYGHDAADVYTQGMSGWKDAALWRAVQEEERFLITGDKGFADIRKHPPGSHTGLMLLRPDQDGIRPTIELLEAVLGRYDLTTLLGTVTVVTPRNIRIRRVRVK